jgi:predicted ATPase
MSDQRGKVLRSLRRIAIFVGNFTLEAALAVGKDGEIGESEIKGAVESLVKKSLVGVRTSSQGTLCRLLDTTRCFGETRSKRRA